MGGLAQKRHYPLMIDEKPPKKAKVSSKTASVKSDASDGPIIHELETNDFLQDDLLAEATESAGNLSSNTKDSMPFIQSPDFVCKHTNIDLIRCYFQLCLFLTESRYCRRTTLGFRATR